MNVEQMLRTGQRVLVFPVVGAAARGLLRRVPARTLLHLGLAPRSVVVTRSAMAIGAPLAGVFVLGAAVGAGLLLLLAPGSAEMRHAIARRIAALVPRTARERARSAAFASATRADHDHDFDHDHEHEHEHDHDEHGRPRRRNHPRA